MERYLVFAGRDYYPNGGWKDFVGEFVSLKKAAEQLRSEIEMSGLDWGHIVDPVKDEYVLLARMDVDNNCSCKFDKEIKGVTL